MTVNVLLATYNGSRFVAAQIDSILQQSYKDLRLIIRDDGSTDTTPDILDTFVKKNPSRILLMPRGRQLGVKGNFSELMQHADGEYIAFADQDDVWDRDKIRLTLEKMKQLEVETSKSTPLLVHTDLRVVDEDLSVLSPSFWKYINVKPSRGHTLNRLLAQNVVTGCTMMMNRALLKLACPIPEQAVMHDWWIALVAAALGKVDALPYPTMLYRQHANNTVGAKKFWSFDYFKDGFSLLRQPELFKCSQVKELLNRYELQLTAEQKKMLQAYLELPQSSWLRKASLITRHGFFKHGALKNLGYVL